MKGRTPRPEATHTIRLTPLKEYCEECGQPLWVGYHSTRTITKLDGLWKVTLVVHSSVQPDCPRYHVASATRRRGALGTATWGIRPGSHCASLVTGATLSIAVCQ